MPTKQTAQLTDCPTNAVWGSADPQNGTISLYPPDCSAAIEAAFASGASTIPVDIFNASITFNDGRPYQQTAAGYRSVFRLDAGEPDTPGGTTRTVSVDVEYHDRLHAWYTCQNRASHIALIVDTSGSMTGIYGIVVEQALEQFVEPQKLEVDCPNLRFYGATFDRERKKLFDGVELKNTSEAAPAPSGDEIRQAFYNVQTTGSTAYYDAVMDTIGEIETRSLPEDEVVICIVTDGADNASRHSTLVSMRTKIEQLKRRGWNIVMIGVNGYNSEEVSEAYGIGRGASLSAGRSTENIRDTFSAVTAGVGRMRQGGGNAEVAFTQEERNGTR